MPKQKPLGAPRGLDTWLTVGRTNLKVHRALNQLLAELDLSLAQHEILVTICRNPNLTQRELADRLHVIKSNATALLKKLEARELVKRRTDNEDSRVNRLNLTRSGRALVEKSFAVQSRVIGAMASVMTDEELRNTADVMHRVGQAIDELLEETG